MAAPREVRILLADYEAAGWRVVHTRANHYRVFAPDGVTLATVPQTPSDTRSVKNARSVLKRWLRHADAQKELR